MGFLNTFLISLLLLCNLYGSVGYAQQNNSHSKTIIVSINSSSDDAEERLSSGYVNLSSADLELSSDNGKNQIVGLRFNDINIPQGAIITSAELVFKPNESNSIWTSLIISAEDSEDAVPFVEAPKNISDRAQTLNAVNWSSISPWSSIDDSYTSPNISKVIQEVINKENWKANNSLALIIEGSGQRTAESYDGSKSEAPILIIEYTEKEIYYTDNKNMIKEIEGDEISNNLSVNNQNQITNNDLESK